MTLAGLTATLRAGRGLAHKADIGAVTAALARVLPDAGAAGVLPGDDCAAIPDGEGGHLLLAIGGFLDEFVAADPRFAGWCGVMVNLSDAHAMGGRPIAVVDALWSRCGEGAAAILEGLAATSRTYGVPIVGGHSRQPQRPRRPRRRHPGPRPQALLSSFAARPGERLLAAIDLRGRYREPHPCWDAATGSPAVRLRADLELPPAIAEAGSCAAAKDVSMGGLIGTAVMLLECSGRLGGAVDVAAVPRPEGVPLARWLASFPSLGFLLSVAEPNVPEVAARFAARGIACAAIGTADTSGVVRLRDGAEEVPFWDLRETPLIGYGRAAA